MGKENEILKVTVEILGILTKHSVPYSTHPNTEINGNKGLFISIENGYSHISYIHVANNLVVSVSFHGTESPKIYSRDKQRAAIQFLDIAFSSEPKQIELFTLDRWLHIATKFSLGKCIYHDLPVFIEKTDTGKWILYMEQETEYPLFKIVYTYFKNGFFQNVTFDNPKENLYLFDDSFIAYQSWIDNVKEKQV
jgi:hypothetical protein